jgi:hypothetical protein
MNNFMVHEIKNTERYEEFLRLVEELMESYPSPNSPLGGLLLTLATRIEEYERSNGWEI